MKKNKFLRYWPFTLMLAGIALVTVLVVSSTPAQAIAGNPSSALQETPPVVTIPAPTVIIPETGGGDTIVVDFFSGWVLWAVLAALVIVLLIALVARPRGPAAPPDTHHHHDL